MLGSLNRPELSLREKLWRMHWLFLLLLCATASVGFAMLYSAGNGNLDPWASRQMARFAFGLVMMVGVAVTNIRTLMRFAYVLYGATLVLLIAVEFGGSVGMGAQRWIDLGFINLQPSELMKVAIVIALARYFHGTRPEDISRLLYLVPPVLILLAPIALVLRQPDLGTAIMLLIGGAAMFFVAGVKIWQFVFTGLIGVAALPVGWQFLKEYQKQRVFTFLNPESDPLGAGYHIIQSKIALGSGGVFGKGFLQGTQSHLSFLPEKQTDFIFTMLAEEFGLVGGLVLLSLYVLLLVYGYALSVRSQSQFGRLAGIGVTTTFFLYVFINIAMVMGVVPVVGVPLPLISYGGTSMMTLLLGFGVLMSVSIHHDVQLGRNEAGD